MCKNKALQVLVISGMLISNSYAGVDFSMSITPAQYEEMRIQAGLDLSAYMAKVLTAYGEAAGEGYSFEDTMSPAAYKKIMDSYYIMQRITTYYTADRYADLEDELYKMNDYLKVNGNGSTYPQFRKFKSVFNDYFDAILAQLDLLNKVVGSSIYAGSIPQ